MLRRHPRSFLLAACLASAVMVGSGACSDGSDQSDGDASTPVGRGEQLAASNGCTSCHSVDGSDGVGPTFAGLAGSEVELDDGTTVTADDEYLRSSIVDPSAQVVDGYRSLMPQRSLDPAEVDDLVAYLNTLGSAAG